jgi:hypothetical protein
MKGLVRDLLRVAVQRARKLVEEVAPPGGNYSHPGFAYSKLNDALLRMIAETPDGLRPSYTWGLLHSAHLARALGIPVITALEFGVAGGNGLLALELAAEKTRQHLGVRVEVHGFDTGKGLPKPTDWRDHPNTFTESDYKMDEGALRSRLKDAQLHLGLVRDTVGGFLASRPSPIGFISFDLDYYGATVDAFEVLLTDPSLLLPRVHCYFDDIMGFTCSEWGGERLAIREFNESHPQRKISPIFGLKYFLPPVYAAQQWSEMMYLAHIFDHPSYGNPDGLVLTRELPLTKATS